MGRLTAAVLTAVIASATVPAAASSQALPDAPYTSYTYGPLPFLARPVWIDDAEDIVASLMDRGRLLVYQVGDTRLRPLPGPNGAPLMRLAMNSKGDVLVLAPENAVLVYHIRSRSYESVGFSLPGLIPRKVGVVAINSANQFLGVQIEPPGDSALIGTYATRPLGAPEGSVSPGARVIRCPDHGNIYPTALNDQGQAVGYCAFRAQRAGDLALNKAFVTNATTGAMTLLDWPGRGFPQPLAINNAGTIVGSVQGSPMAGSFVYQDGKFTRLGGPAGAINNAGTILALGGLLAPNGKPAPRVSQAWNTDALEKALDPFFRRADAAVPAGGAPAKRHTPPVVDPNITLGDTLGGGMSWDWQWEPNQLPKVKGGARYYGSRYLGFNAEGSWLWVEKVLYIWNARDRALVASLTPPAAPLQLPDLPADEVTSAGAAPPPSASTPQPAMAPGTPHAENATFTTDASGSTWLSYVFKSGGPDMSFRLKVVRPTNRAPGNGLAPPVLGPNNTGTWIWIGEADQLGKAAIFNYDASGTLIGVPVDPAAAKLYFK